MMVVFEMRITYIGLSSGLQGFASDGSSQARGRQKTQGKSERRKPLHYLINMSITMQYLIYLESLNKLTGPQISN